MKQLLLAGFVLAIAGCGGGGGTDSKLVALSVPTVSQIRVTTDLLQVNYPSTYTTEHQALLTVDPCQLDFNTVDYPKEWNGKYQLPVTSGAKLRDDIQRGVWLKDIMLPNNPSINTGCTGDLFKEFDKTLSRLKKLNIDYVMVPQWHWLTTYSNGSWAVLSAEQSNSYALRDRDLEVFVKKIHSAGIKVMMINTVQGMVSMKDGDAIMPESNTQNYKLWLKAYTEFMYERAVYFQALNIDLWEAGCNNCIYSDHGDNIVDNQLLFYQTYQNVLNNITKVYKNKLLVHYTPWLVLHPEYLDQIEYIKIGHYGSRLSVSEIENLSVDTYKKALQRDGLQSWITSLGRYNKKIIFEFGIQSRADAFSNPGYMEETSCVSSMGALNVSKDVCIQKNTKPDFSLQAIVMQATLETINSTSLPEGSMVLILDYWQTDTIHPGVAFPNIASSIRNKPSEGIVKSWFSKG